ncbi:MAG TPA: phage holin family protein [Streptosporangiaceae bacterium]|nr:phage holin family protein [Streptosporangiaceae bacterium]
MAEPAPRRPADNAADQSLGNLVSMAVSDVSTLIKCELDLAKIELKKDVTRLGIGGALIGVAAFVACLILLFGGFAYAYGLSAAAAIPLYAAFGCVALTCLFLAAVAGLIGATRFRKLSGLRRTRKTVQEDLTLLKREDGAAAAPVPRAG